MFKTIIFINN